MATTSWPVYGEISGPVVMIGFGSIGRGTLPLIERHFKFDRSRMVVIDPQDTDRALLDDRGIAFVQEAVTKKNYKKLLTPLLTAGEGQGFCVNLSVDTSSLELMKLCRKLGVLYIDTVVEPWLGFYFDSAAGNESRTNYALRETVREEARKNPGGTTAISCCGANPGMVSWFVKRALVNLAGDLGLEFEEPAVDDRRGWAKLMKKAGVKGIHIAERDTQRAREPKPFNVFWNTWSVEGFISEGLQPAELGWGTHEKWMPKNAREHKTGCRAAIYLEQPGANTRVRTWCPTPGAQYGFLVTHNEAISIADFFTRRNKKDEVTYRPTCHYAYHPCNDAVLSLHEMFGAAGTLAAGPPRARRERADRRHRRAGRAALRPRQERLLVRLAPLAGRGAPAGALSERHRAAGHLGRAGRHGVGAGEPRGGHRRDRRDGLSPLPRGAGALSRPAEGLLHGLDAAGRPAGPVFGGHRPQGPVAVPQHPGPLEPRADRRSACFPAGFGQWERQGGLTQKEPPAMNTPRKLIPAGSLAALLLLAGCMSGGPGGFGGTPRGVEGEWLSTDGVAVSRFNGGMFETVATDTGNRLASGTYQMTGQDAVTINGTSLIRQTPVSFNCLMATPAQLNCTSTSGQQFVLNRRQATS